MSVENDEGLICIRVMVPNEVSLQPSELELIVVHLRDHSGRPLLGETLKLVCKINRSVKVHSGLHPQTHRCASLMTSYAEADARSRAGANPYRGTTIGL